jgi:hypothetical protein
MDPDALECNVADDDQRSEPAHGGNRGIEFGRPNVCSVAILVLSDGRWVGTYRA